MPIVPRNAGRRASTASSGATAARRNSCEQLNDLGVLTSRYDIYQDVMDPANSRSCAGCIRDWTTRRLAQGPHARRATATGSAAGRSRARTASGIPAACSATGRRWPTPSERDPGRTGDASLPLPVHRHHHRRRPGASAIDPDHPMTRTESRECEDGAAATTSAEDCRPGHRQRDRPRRRRAVRALLRGHAEPGALPRAGLRAATCSEIVDEVPERGGEVPDRATATGCRSGSWSTTIAWSPSGTGATTTTSCPASGTSRDLFNALYGTPPMFMFNRELWEREPRPLRAELPARPRRWPGRPATPRCSPTAG